MPFRIDRLACSIALLPDPCAILFLTFLLSKHVELVKQGIHHSTDFPSAVKPRLYTTLKLRNGPQGSSCFVFLALFYPKALPYRLVRFEKRATCIASALLCANPPLSQNDHFVSFGAF